MIRIKICGITNIADALMAAELGVHALGFIFAHSPRRVSPVTAQRIISTLPPFVKSVGVFVNERVSVIREIMDFCGLDLVQLHGSESPEVCRELMPRSIKAFRMLDTADFLSMNTYRGNVRAFLMDTYQKGVKGGTGKTFNWNLAIEAGNRGFPIILSGGLNPTNIIKAVSLVKPHAVDVNSGIEEYPGKKDAHLMKLLIENIRKCCHMEVI